MKHDIQKAISHATSLQEIVTSFNNLCKSLYENGDKRIGYVAGILFSEGPEHVQKNIHILQKHTEKVRAEHQFPVFSSVDLFYTNEFYDQIKDTKLPYAEKRNAFFAFYREILSNSYITDIFMTPRWELSQGATDEHNTAKKQKLIIHYVKDLNE